MFSIEIVIFSLIYKKNALFQRIRSFVNEFRLHRKNISNGLHAIAV